MQKDAGVLSADKKIRCVREVVASSAVEGTSAEPGGDGLLCGPATLDIEEIAAGTGEDGDGLAIGLERVASAGELLGDEVFDGTRQESRSAFQIGEALALIVLRKEGGRQNEASG